MLYRIEIDYYDEYLGEEKTYSYTFVSTHDTSD